VLAKHFVLGAKRIEKRVDVVKKKPQLVVRASEFDAVAEVAGVLLLAQMSRIKDDKINNEHWFISIMREATDVVRQRP